MIIEQDVRTLVVHKAVFRNSRKLFCQKCITIFLQIDVSVAFSLRPDCKKFGRQRLDENWALIGC